MQYKSSKDFDLSRPVQTAITSVSFPDKLERLRAMGKKWLDLVGKDWITDMDLLMDFPTGRNIPWIAPKWLTSGDILFFYHTKRAKSLIDRLSRETKSLIYSHIPNAQFSKLELEKLFEILERQAGLANLYSGTMFGFAEVSGRPQRIFDEKKHFKGTIYAPLDTFHTFEHPLHSEQFNDVLRIGQNTTTPMYGEQFESIKNKLRVNNQLPVTLDRTRPTGLGFRDVNANNWIQVSCDKNIRFVNEAQIRTYLIDYFLDDIKDTRTPIYTECDCLRDNLRTGIADYFIRLGGSWLPVEAKLNVQVEQDLLGQVEKYTHIDSFVSTIRGQKGGLIPTGRLHLCLVIDQAGIYLIRDGIFINCSLEKPLFKREEFPTIIPEPLRSNIIRILQ